jgi:hypothetical protein
MTVSMLNRQDEEIVLQQPEVSFLDPDIITSAEQVADQVINFAQEIIINQSQDIQTRIETIFQRSCRSEEHKEAKCQDDELGLGLVLHWDGF